MHAIPLELIRAVLDGEVPFVEVAELVIGGKLVGETSKGMSANLGASSFVKGIDAFVIL
jgi:hypothetical protein